MTDLCLLYTERLALMLIGTLRGLPDPELVAPLRRLAARLPQLCRARRPEAFHRALLCCAAWLTEGHVRGHVSPEALAPALREVDRLISLTGGDPMGAMGPGSASAAQGVVGAVRSSP